jgi:long-chain acyl-CoA synthetase
MVVTLQQRVADRGDELAIADEFGEWTWREYNERANRLANGLRGLGLGLGDTMGIVGNNRHEWLLAMSVGQVLGMTTVPVNWHFSAEEIAYVFENSGATVVIGDAEFAETVRAAAGEARVGVRISYGGAIDGFTDIEEVIAAGSPDEPENQVAGRPMLYTSGTSGRPKGVQSSLQQIGGDPVESLGALGLLMSLYRLDGFDAKVVLCNAPLYHGGPLAFGLIPFALGSRLILRRKWNAEETLRLIDEHQVSVYYAVPTHFTRLLKLPDETRASFSGASLQYVMHTAAPCPPSVKQQMIDWWGPVLMELYGASEAGGVGTIVDSHEWLERPGTVGRPTAVAEVLIIGDDGDVLGPNKVGQIYVKSLMGIDFTYLGDDEKTAKAHLEPGVFTFGDIGYLDDDGYLFLSDRKIDMIISGGVNIYPAEIEAVIISHPAVADCGVFGVPNDEYGEEVKAAVELVDGADARSVERELQAMCRERLAGYMCPRSYDFGPLPRTATGKLPKRELRAKYWEGTGRSI